MRSLVTGGEGFVGRHLLARLLEAGDVIHATTPGDVAGGRRVAGPGEPAVRAFEGATWHRADVLEPETVRLAVQAARPDRVFHLAGFSSGARARERGAEALTVNAVGTLHVLEAVAERGGSPIPVLVAGSGDVYGASPDPLAEEAPMAPGGPYGASKAAQELVALAVARTRGLDVRVARLFPLVGPGQSDAFVVPGFCRQAARIAEGGAEPVILVGNLDVERDFTDVRDGVEALARLAGLDAPAHRAYNVCSGHGVRVRTLLRWILEEAGIDPRVQVDPARVRPGEAPRLVGTPARLVAETGWEPERDVRQAVADTYRWVAGRGTLSARS